MTTDSSSASMAPSPDRTGSSASAGPSRPRSNPWASASTSTPPAKPAWGASSQPPSSSTSAGFPTLSSSSSHPTRKRDRGSPWKPAPRQSYPSRLQEIQARALERRAREDEAQLLEETSASSPPRMMTLDELTGATPADGEGEDADFYRGPAQMYGMSRVVVRDLSEAGPGKGKGKNKVRERDVTGGPQVYSRHNAPWVQRAKRGREEGGVAEDEVTGKAPSGSSVNAELGATPPIVYATTASSSLEEVVAAYHRATRIQAARRRAEAPSTSTLPLDPLEGVLEKLQHDIEIGKPLSSVPAALASLPQDAAARCITAIASSITASAPRHSSAALWQLLRLCLDLSFDEEASEGYSAWQAMLHALHAYAAEAKPTETADEEARSLVTRLLVPLNAGVAYAYTTSAPPASLPLAHLAHTLHLIRLAHPGLPSSTFYATSLNNPRAQDLLCSLDDDDDGSTYAFLLPLSTTKLRLISGEAERIAEEARRQRLWASFYHAGSRDGEDRNAPPRLQVRRTHILEDTLTAVQDPHNDLAWQHGAHLNVTFVGEEGVDSVLGGLRREWLSLLVAELVKRGVVKEAEEGGVVVLCEGASEEHARLFGLVVGIGLLLGVPCGLRLGSRMVRWLLSEGNQPDEARALEDLDEAYPTLARNLRTMLDWQPVEGEMDADATFQRTFSLNWTIVDHPGSIPRPLVSGGQHRPVTLSNRHAYAQSLATHRLYGSALRPLLDAAREGFGMAWPARSRAWLRSWLAEEELVSLVEGPTRIEVGLLQRTVQVVNPRRGGEDGPLLIMWWEAAEMLQLEDESFAEKLLAFVTGSPRLPLSFLAASEGARLPAPFAIHLVDEDSLPASSGSLSLPWASTCTMTLFLPRSYAKVGVEELVERLRRSVELGVEGFGLK